MVSSDRIKFSVDGTELKGILEKPKGTSTSVVVILHPHPLYGGDIYNPVITTLSDVFTEMGYATFRFNFRGVSKPSEYQGVSGAVIDVAAAIATLKNHSLRIVGIAGYSFGGSTALRYSSNNDVHFLVSISSSLALIEEGDFQTTQLSSIKCPVLMFHGTSDLTVPHQSMDIIASFLSSNVKCISLKGEGHFYHASLGMVGNEVKTFLENLQV